MRPTRPASRRRKLAARCSSCPANETPFGPSPKAIQKPTRAPPLRLEDYPEGTSRILREAIRHAFRLDPDRIICGAGSDELLNLLAHVYLGRGDEAISTTHGFLVYLIATMASSATIMVAPETEYTADHRCDAQARHAAHQARLARQPEQPDRNLSAVRRVESGYAPDCRRHVLLVLDAAYADYVSRNDYEMGIELVATTENTVMTHTFSKNPRPCSAACGVDVQAGSHRGCSQSHPRAVQRLNTGDAGSDRGHRDSRTWRCRGRHTVTWRNRLARRSASSTGITPSVANFVLIHFPLDAGKTAADADAFLTERGLVLRGLKVQAAACVAAHDRYREANRLVIDGATMGSKSEYRAAFRSHRADRLRPDRRLDRALRASRDWQRRSSPPRAR